TPLPAPNDDFLNLLEILITAYTAYTTQTADAASGQTIPTNSRTAFAHYPSPSSLPQHLLPLDLAVQSTLAPNLRSSYPPSWHSSSMDFETNPTHTPCHPKR
ncbi:MAG: hypothetical protein Q9205_002800, partial [Flavoplaca limonia]